MPTSVLRVLSVALLAAALAACQNSSPTPQQQAAARKAAAEAQAQQKLATYRKLVQMKSYDLAVPIGEAIEHDFPGTKAAAEVATNLDAVRKQGEELAEKTRLQRLWLYQVGPMEGGVQSTAAIMSSRPAGVNVRLVLRRHSKWGRSAFLYDTGGVGFVCKGRCNIPVHFDGHARTIKGYLPHGGEPALFIDDDKAFIEALEKARDIRMEIQLKGAGKRTLVYEVGGFDPDKWKPAK